MTHVTEQLSSVEISAITPRVHDWMQTKPGSEPWFVAIAALQFGLETDFGPKTQQEYTGLLTGLLADKIPYDDAEYEGRLLGERDQAMVALAVGMLAGQNAAVLADSSLCQFAPRVAAARLYAGGPIDESANVPEPSNPTYEQQLDAICYPAGREVAAVTPSTHSQAAAPETYKETPPWRTIFKLGPLAIGFAVQPKHA